MKTEDLKNYIFEQCLTEKTHPLVMRGAQWVVDEVGGDAKKLARRMSTGINRTAKEPTLQHVYNAAHFHFGDLLRKNSPKKEFSIEDYESAKKRLRAHLGMDGEVNETSDALKQKLIDARHEQGWTAARDGDKLFHEYMGQDPETGKPGKKREGYGDPALLGVRDIRRKEMKKAWASSDKAKNRLKGLKGDGSKRTSTQESAFNFINGLKRLQEAKKFPPITIEELQSPDATKHHARRGVKHPDPKVAIEALKLAFRLNDAKTAWMGKDHPDQEVRDTAEMSMNMDEN